MKPISVWGWLGGHDGQRSMGKLGQDAGVTPLLFFEGHPGIFNDDRESETFNSSCASSWPKSWEFKESCWFNISRKYSVILFLPGKEQLSILVFDWNGGTPPGSWFTRYRYHFDPRPPGLLCISSPTSLSYLAYCSVSQPGQGQHMHVMLFCYPQPLGLDPVSFWPSLLGQPGPMIYPGSILPFTFLSFGQSLFLCTGCQWLTVSQPYQLKPGIGWKVEDICNVLVFKLFNCKLLDRFRSSFMSSQFELEIYSDIRNYLNPHLLWGRPSRPPNLSSIVD